MRHLTPEERGNIKRDGAFKSRSLRGDWDLEDVCTVLGAISLLLVGAVGVPLCFYWDSRCVLLTIGSLVALCIIARVVHERRTAACHMRHRWLSLTTSFLVQHSPQEREPLTSSRSTYSV
ncbi:hypothetical protein MTO96_013821 [Rhipicephalus appendiculatus]